MNAKIFYVYILASSKHGTLYIGMTSDIKKRMWEHKNKVVDGFTEKYDVDRLVFFEQYENFEQASLREQRMKAWKRDWKVNLIEEHNPEWNDLYDGLSY